MVRLSVVATTALLFCNIFSINAFRLTDIRARLQQEDDEWDSSPPESPDTEVVSFDPDNEGDCKCRSPRQTRVDHSLKYSDCMKWYEAGCPNNVWPGDSKQRSSCPKANAIAFSSHDGICRAWFCDEEPSFDGNPGFKCFYKPSDATLEVITADEEPADEIRANLAAAAEALEEEQMQTDSPQKDEDDADETDAAFEAAQQALKAQMKTDSHQNNSDKRDASHAAIDAMFDSWKSEGAAPDPDMKAEGGDVEANPDMKEANPQPEKLTQPNATVAEVPAKLEFEDVVQKEGDQTEESPCTYDSVDSAKDALVQAQDELAREEDEFKRQAHAGSEEAIKKKTESQQLAKSLKESQMVNSLIALKSFKEAVSAQDGQYKLRLANKRLRRHSCTIVV
jgi:hypothetical protein